jgi:hypothetical protein
MSHAIRLILGSHRHVPFGAPEDGYERVYRTALKPFLSALYRYPKIQAVLHYSGDLFHWMEKAHPEIVLLIGDLLSRKQVELLGGGFHEPMLTLIPMQDKIGQIEFFTTWLRKQFGRKPQGCWIPGLAWEQNLVSPLNACGMVYTFLDEEQFKSAGLEGRDLYCPCVSEDQGKTIIVFPLSGRLKRGFAEKRASIVLRELAEELPAGGDCTVSVFPEHFFAEDGSSQPADVTFHNFFEELSRCESYVDFTCPGKLYRSLAGLKRACFPDSLGDAGESGAAPGCGYPRSGERVLPRRFIIDTPEANGIYSKMFFTHVLINQLRGDKSRKQAAREELWKAQNYDLYCPGKYHTGIGSHTLRKAAYRALLGAEKITRETGKFLPSLTNFDFDLDGEGEYLFQGEKINCYVRLRGAGVFELDFLPKPWNYLDTLFPSPEEKNRRGSFTEYLFPAEFSIADLGEGRVSGVRYCGNERFQAVEMDKTRLRAAFVLAAGEYGPFSKLEVKKTYSVKKDTLSAAWSLTNHGTERQDFVFAPSIDLSFPGEGDAFVRVYRSGEKDPVAGEGIIGGTEGLKFQDVKNGVAISLGSRWSFDTWILPSRTAESYQSTWILPRQRVSLEGEAVWDTEFTMKFS